jgi:hypothetical protein
MNDSTGSLPAVASNESGENVDSEPIVNADTVQNQEDDDCVFNDDYKGLTTKWLAEVGKTDFVWREDLEQAVIAMGMDTIFVLQGGCSHFGFLVELRLSDDRHTLSDTAFWLTKAQGLAKDFDFEHYEKALGENMYTLEKNENSIWFSVEDDDPDDNMIYNGVEVSVKGNSKIISLSQYLN